MVAFTTTDTLSLDDVLAVTCAWRLAHVHVSHAVDERDKEGDTRVSHRVELTQALDHADQALLDHSNRAPDHHQNEQDDQSGDHQTYECGRRHFLSLVSFVESHPAQARRRASPAGCP